MKHDLSPPVSLLTACLAVLLLLLCGGPLRAEQEAIPEITVNPTPPPPLGALPQFTTELARRGAKAFASRDWEAAREAYAEIVEADPGNALALSNLGAAEFQLGNLEAAEKAMASAVREKPDLSQSWITLGLIYYRQNKLILAVSSLTRSISEEPTDHRAHRYLALVIRELGWIRGAEAELQKALELNPEDAEAHFNLALMYLERHDPAIELARRHYYRAIDLGAEADAEIETKLAENR